MVDCFSFLFLFFFLCVCVLFSLASSSSSLRGEVGGGSGERWRVGASVPERGSVASFHFLFRLRDGGGGGVY